MTLLRASLLSGIVTVARIASGLVLNKLYALVLGPAGLAIVGQFTTFASMTYGLSTAGLGNGVTRYVASNPPNLPAILGTAFAACSTVTMIASLVLISIPADLAQWLLGSANHGAAIALVALSNLVIAPSALLLATLNGQRDLRAVTLFGLLGVGLSLCVTIALTLTLGLFGALIAQAIAQALLGIVLIGYFWRHRYLSRLDFSLPDITALRTLLQYSLMSIVAALALPLALIGIRNHIAETLSWNDVGYWQGMWRISEVYMLAVTGALTTYLLPRFSELSTSQELRRELIDAFKLLVPMIAVFGFTIYAFRHMVIRILFDERFHAMADLFAFQLIGDVAKIAAWILAYMLIAKSMTTAYIVLEIVFVSMFVLLTFNLVDRFGLIGATYAYAITYFFNFVVLALIVRRYLAKLQAHEPNPNAAA